MKPRTYHVYIMTNPHHTVLYTGVTGDLVRRVWEHKQKLHDGFTRRYNVVKLVYAEECTDIHTAIAREKQIKGGSRQKKLDLINAQNPDWHDLYEDAYVIAPLSLRARPALPPRSNPHSRIASQMRLAMTARYDDPH